MPPGASFSKTFLLPVSGVFTLSYIISNSYLIKYPSINIITIIIIFAFLNLGFIIHIISFFFYAYLNAKQGNNLVKYPPLPLQDRRRQSATTSKVELILNTPPLYFTRQPLGSTFLILQIIIIITTIITIIIIMTRVLKLVLIAAVPAA